MKYKNYKSAIHNFTHSFICIDYTKSAYLSVNALIDLHNLKKETKAIFDFTNKSTKPIAIESKNNLTLINDYLNWLPNHFNNHNCDLMKLEKLEIVIWTNFEQAKSPLKMNNIIELTVNALTKWKVNGKSEQSLEISQTELINKEFLKLRLPEL